MSILILIILLSALLNKHPKKLRSRQRRLKTCRGLSFRKNREYCGYIGLNRQGELETTPRRRGRQGSCRPNDPPRGFQILASYHSHGAYSEWFESEIPSFEDLNADIEEGVDGYISTPGGRLWFNDARKEAAVLLCDEGCLTMDTGYNPDDGQFIESVYTLNDLSN